MNKMVILVILVIFTGCQTQQESYSVEQNQSIDKVNDTENETDEEILTNNNVSNDNQVITKNNEEEKVELYNYDKIFDYIVLPKETLEVADIEAILQDVDLDVKSVEFESDKRVIITYILDLSEENSKYEFQRLKEVQNSIVLFSIYENIEDIVFLYRQEGLYTNEITYNRDELLMETNIDNLNEYIQNKEHFEKIAEVIEKITYTPDVMPFVTYSDLVTRE